MPQTAVEWLVEKIKLKYDLDLYHVKKEIEQANQMFQEQIEDAATWGALAETGEQYYKEKYKK
jgi:hypothetical protein